MNTEPAWHLDRRVPVALIITMCIQIASFAYFISAINSQVQINTRDIAVNSRVLEQSRMAAQQQAIQLGRVEEGISGLRSDVGRLLRLLEQQ